MILKKLNIISFGKFKNRELIFENGMNVIHGANEVGKSTVAMFIQFILYGFPKKAATKDIPLPDGEKYLPWDAQILSGSMTVEWKGRDILIERSFSPDARAKSADCYDAVSGEKLSEFSGNQPGEIMLGVTAETFVRTAFIKQNDLTTSASGELESRLTNLATGGEEDTSYEKASIKIDNALKKIQNQRKGGILPDLLREEIDLQREYAMAQGEFDRWSDAVKELEVCKERAEALKEQEEKLKAETVTVKGAGYRVRLDMIEKAEKDIARLQEEYSQLKSSAVKDGKDLDAVFISDLKSLVATKSTLMAKLSGLSESFGTEDRETITYTKKGSTALTISIVLAALAVALMLLGVILGINYPLIILAVLLVATSGGFLRWHCWKKARSKKKEQKEKDADNARRLEANSAYAAIENEILEIDEKVSNMFRILSDRLLEMDNAQAVLRQLEEIYENIRDKAARINEAKARMEGLLQGSTKAEIKALSGDIAEDCPGKSAEILEQELDHVRRLRMENIEKQSTLTTACERFFADGRTPDLILSRLRQIEREKNDATGKKNALSLAKAALDGAFSTLQSFFAPEITGRAKEYFDEFTGDGERGLFFSKKDGVSMSQDGLMRKMQYFSAGTADAAYLAVRIAVTDMIYEDEKPTLVLDDAFTCFDDGRLKKAISLLKTISCRYQILLFTCREEEKRILSDANIIEM